MEGWEGAICVAPSVDKSRRMAGVPEGSLVVSLHVTLSTAGSPVDSHTIVRVLEMGGKGQHRAASWQ